MAGPEPLTAQVVLITGAASDIGQATALAFAQAGFAVVVNSHRNRETLDALALSLQAAGAPQTLVQVADIRHRIQVVAMLDAIFTRFGRLDVLVNNAGLNRDRPFLQLSEEDWDVVVSTILEGTFLCSQEFARRYQGQDGRILNIGSTTALKGRKNGANYCSARAGVLALSKCMALELAPRIRVNVVTPGRIDTREVRARYDLNTEEDRVRFSRDVPIGRMGKPEEVAAMILFLAVQGSYITGQNFFVDGGVYMR
ncbi:MAG: SDR family oxidoreductase [Coprothermobacterota bacterium]|nr:SDR family oxidoreductase [Coprothermobacterota bacterium]